VLEGIGRLRLSGVRWYALLGWQHDEAQAHSRLLGSIALIKLPRRGTTCGVSLCVLTYLLMPCASRTSPCRQALMTTVDKLPSLRGKCITGGRLNVARALAKLQRIPAPPPPPPTKCEGGGHHACACATCVRAACLALHRLASALHIVG